MNRPFISPLIVIVLSIALASCAVVKEKTIIEPANWKAEQLKRQQISVWEIRGRLGLQTETTGGVLDIIWKQSEEDYSIRLIAPLGAGSYLIQGNDKYADVRYPDGRKEIISNVDDAFLSALQVKLPVSAIRDWLRGLPAKQMPIDKINWNDKGLLNRLQQSGWNVEMKKYTGADILLPHAIYLSRDDKPELDIRLILRQWLVDNQ